MNTYRKYMNSIREEVDSAMDYAEKSAMFKNKKPDFSRMYHEMAMDELKHAEYLKNIGQIMMDETTTSETCQKAWMRTISDMASKTATIKMMLSSSTTTM